MIQAHFNCNRDKARKLANRSDNILKALKAYYNLKFNPSKGMRRGGYHYLVSLYDSIYDSSYKELLFHPVTSALSVPEPEPYRF
jgi:hypothetical protein